MCVVIVCKREILIRMYHIECVTLWWRVFHCYYSLTDDTDPASWTEVRAEFTPSDHTWVGAKIGLFANIVGEKEAGGYGDFEYLHVEALED